MTSRVMMILLRERLYQNIFASHFGQLAIIFSVDVRKICFHVAWQGNFESWIQDPLHVRTYCSCNLGSSFWSTRCRGPLLEEVLSAPVNIAYSGVYQWWYTIGLRTNEDLYTGALFLLCLFCYIFNSRLVTPTTQMETQPFRGLKMPNLASIIICQDLFGVSSLGLGRTFSSCLLSPDPGGSTSDGIIS
ncbi:putative photosystem I [Dioscorea sansibarensis]